MRRFTRLNGSWHPTPLHPASTPINVYYIHYVINKIISKAKAHYSTNPEQQEKKAVHNVFFSLSAGVIIGLILNFAFPPSKSLLYDLACPEYECDGVTSSRCADVSAFQIGEDIQLRSAGGQQCRRGVSDENVVIAEVLGKVFKDRNGNYIEQTVSQPDIHVGWRYSTTSFFLFSLGF